jgi:hypothetical protein
MINLFSRILFGSYFTYHKTISGNLNATVHTLSKVFTVKGIKGSVSHQHIELTWDEHHKKFQFLGTLKEEGGSVELKGKFVLAPFHTILHLLWFSFWTVWYILWEFGQAEFYREGDENLFLLFIVLGLIMFVVFLVRINRKAKQIIDILDQL